MATVVKVNIEILIPHDFDTKEEAGDFALNQLTFLDIKGGRSGDDGSFERVRVTDCQLDI